MLNELKEQKRLGALEVLQAQFLSERLSVVWNVSQNDLGNVLGLMLSVQRDGSTAATIEDLRDAAGELWEEHGQSVQDTLKTLERVEQKLLIHRELGGVLHWGVQRAYQAEERIAAKLQKWASVGKNPEITKTIFPGYMKPHELQIKAVKMALRQQFCVVSGGPGTGKTTVVRAIVDSVCATFHIVKDRVVVCAPTGRAKARLVESTGGDLEGRTLHSLLRYRENGEPSFNTHNPLPYDLVVVDEVSMVDSAMFADLMDAVDHTARLVVVGDMHQLPSVESGAVLGDLTLSRREQLKDQFVELTHNFRSDKKILNWWFAVVAGKEPGAWNPMIATEDLELKIRQWLNECRTSWAALKQKAGAGIDQVPISEFKAYIESGRVLTCTNHGPQGRHTLNSMARYWWTGEQPPKYAKTEKQAYLDGEPLIVEQNQVVGGVELYNGDLGVVLVQNGRQKGLFYSGGKVCEVDLPLISGLQRAYAITVHKSQGSEFKKVILALPAEDRRMVTEQLVYTAVTRAKTELMVCDPAGLLVKGLEKERRRTWLGGNSK